MAKMIIIEGNSNDKDNVRAYMVKGEQGKSAYDLYKENGGTLTEEQWLDEFINAENFYNKTESDTLLGAKVNTADIKDNLTSTDTDKPLSANQGKVLKDLVDEINTFQKEVVTATATRTNCTQELTATFRRVGNVVTVDVVFNVVSTDNTGGTALISFTDSDNPGTGFTHIDFPNFAKTQETDSENTIYLGYGTAYDGNNDIAGYQITKMMISKGTSGNYMFRGVTKFDPNNTEQGNEFWFSFTYLVED